MLGLWVDAAREEVSLDLLSIQIAPDENHFRNARFTLGPLVLALFELDLFMHTLENILGVALQEPTAGGSCELSVPVAPILLGARILWCTQLIRWP